MPDLPPWIRKKCLKTLYKICGHFALLPKSLKINVRYDQTVLPHHSGGFSDVWKGSYRGRAVAVKVLRMYSNSSMQKQIGVRWWLRFAPSSRADVLTDCVLDVLQRSDSMEDPSASKYPAISWGDDV